MRRFVLAMSWLGLAVLEAEHHKLRGVIEWYQGLLLPESERHDSAAL